MKEQLKVHTPDPDVPHVTSKSVSLPIRTDSATSPFSSDKHVDRKWDHCRSKHHICSFCRHQRQRRDDIRSYRSTKSAKSDDSSSDFQSHSDLFHTWNWNEHHLKDCEPKLLRPENNGFGTHCTTTLTTSTINHPIMMNIPLKESQNWQNDSRCKWRKHFRLIRPNLDSEFQSTFKCTCDTNGVQEGAVMWHLHYFMKKPADDAFDSCMALSSRRYWHRKERPLINYCEVLKLYPGNLLQIRCYSRNGRWDTVL